MDTETTDTIFRRWPDGDVIALFPGIEHTGRSCMSYQHVGQHGGADYQGVVSRTKPARPAEYADLLSELQSIGYKLRVLRRAAYQHHFYT
jgi:hypothetical protein